MPRKPRIEAPGTIHHVTSRGVNRAVIFRDDADYEAFLRFLALTCKQYEWRCIAYCLMPKHLHLVVETHRPNLGAGMQYLASSYARRHHHRYRSTGHLFGGRFHSLLINRDAYLLEVVRYVLLNPVTAGLCRRARDWHWSSARESLGLAPAPSWLGVGIACELLGPSDGRGAERLARHLEAGDRYTGGGHDRRQAVRRKA